MIRRTFLAASAIALFAVPAYAQQVHALPDARFVGFAQTVNDFEIQSGQLALQKSQNELVRSYAQHTITEYTENAQFLVKNRAEAGVTMAPDEEVRKLAEDAIARLNSL